MHAWVRAFTGELVKYRVTADAHADCRAFGVDHALRGALVFFDRGDSSSSPWPWNRQVDELLTLRVRAAWGEHRHRVLLPDGERARRLADPHTARVTSRGATLVLGYPRYKPGKCLSDHASGHGVGATTSTRIIVCQS